MFLKTEGEVLGEQRGETGAGGWAGKSKPSWRIQSRRWRMLGVGVSEPCPFVVVLPREFIDYKTSLTTC